PADASTTGAWVPSKAWVQILNEPFPGLVVCGGDVQTIRGDLTRLDDVINNPVAPRLAETAVVAGEQTDKEPSARRLGLRGGKLAGAIEMRSVTFGYSQLEAPLLEGIDVHIEPGQRIALVGASGSGKSTIAKLLSGLYEPWSGEIYYDGMALTDIPHQAFAASVAAVDQDIFLFEGSIRDNVTLWDQSLDDAEVSHALADAGVLDTVATRAGGIAARVAEAGRNFSGGERQRLQTARALL